MPTLPLPLPIPIPRTSLAALVCPSAPFLTPRLLRTCVPLAARPPQCLVPAAGRRYKSDAKAFRKQQLSQRHARKQQVLDEHATLLQQMRKACDDRDLRALLDLYPSFIATRALTRDDTRRIAQNVHMCVRNQRMFGISVEDLLPFLQQVIQDIQKGILPPHPYAFVHILGIYKECKKYDEGYALWQWLVQQDNNYVSQAVYGAAIELLAYGKKLRLPELEHLYTDALKRFPGTFAEYHLSPDAIVPNRRQPTVIADLPITLLQGILTARILHNDWKNSYLALDTALRLYPSQLPTRFFELFMMSRQLGEAYTVFLVACRAGNILKPSHLTTLIGSIRKAIQDCEDLRDRMLFLRAIANALYAYLEAGGSLEPIHVGQFLTSFGLLLPEPVSGKDYEGDMASLRNRIATFAHGTLSSLFRAGMPPSSHAFIALINLAGKLRVPDLLRVSLQDTQTAQVDIGYIGIRTALTSAGQTGAKDLIEEYWARIVHNAAEEGKQIDRSDWLCFSKACRRAEHMDYFRAQMSEQEHAIPVSLRDSLVARLDDELSHTEKTSQVPRSEASETEFAELEKQIKNISAIVMSGQRLDLRTTPFYMSLDPERPPIGELEDMQEIYDEYTTDPHQPPPDDSLAPAALSPTGIPLDELRFMNWVSVVELMDQARLLEKEKQQMIENIRRTGQDIARVKARSRFQRDSSLPLALKHLRDYIKNLRDAPVGQSLIQKPRIVQLNTHRIPDITRILPESEVHQPLIRQRNRPDIKPLRIIHQASGKHYRHISPTAEPPTSNPKLSRRPLDREYDSRATGTGSPVSASAPSEAGSISTSFPHLPTKAGSLKLYVGLKSDHVAPIPTRLSRNPLGKRKAPNHHLFGQRSGENEGEGGVVAEKGETAETGAEATVRETKGAW